LNHLPFNAVDIAVIGVLIISGLMAFSRGLVREVLSIAAWVGAAAATVYAFPHLRPYARGYIKNETLADIATGVAIFVVTLFVATAVSHMLARNVRGSGFGALDRSLGFFFGLARGAVLVCLAYLLFTWAVPKPDDQPDAIKQAQSLRVIAPGAELIRSLLPKDALTKSSQAADAAKTAVEQQLGQQALDSISQPAPKSAATKTDPGYNANERKDLDRLIQGSQ
jgi:membrane protein required for colicin V production